MPQTQTQTTPKVTEIALKTKTKNDGAECVQRNPGFVREVRQNVDVIRLSNKNNSGSDESITVSIDPARAAALFSPVPAAQTVLQPGDSVDWTLKAVLQGTVSVNYTTDPSNCQGHDQGDIEIAC